MIQIRTYENIKWLMKAASEFILYHHLEEDIEHGEVETTMETNTLILIPEMLNHIPGDFVRNLALKLKEYTGKDWVVKITERVVKGEDAPYDRIQVLKPTNKDNILFDLDIVLDDIEMIKTEIINALYYYDKVTDRECKFLKIIVEKHKDPTKLIKLLDVFDVPYSVY